MINAVELQANTIVKPWNHPDQRWQTSTDLDSIAKAESNLLVLERETDNNSKMIEIAIKNIIVVEGGGHNKENNVW